MMLKSVLSVLIYSALMVFTGAGPKLHGQENRENTQILQDGSMTQFENGEYRSALQGFRKLIDQYQGEPLYRYYAGRCLVELNDQLDEAIELLYHASQRNVPKDVTFYLGLAYHRFYNFREARKYFERYGISANRQEKKDYNIKHLLATTRSAEEITSDYNPFEVMNVTFLDLSDSLQYSQVKMKGGQLGRKPDLFYMGEEDSADLSHLMFILPRPMRGDYQYFAGKRKNGKGGTQLFRVKKLTGNSWSVPEELSSLNTDGNEILPYFDPIEEDLYFASDGYFGIGGYDLYRSHYDRERDQWTEPMNLGFPVNSAMDDYLLLPGTDLGMVLFFSNRQVTDSTIAVYRVHLSEPKKKTEANNEKMLREIAQLGGVAEEILADLQRMQSPEEALREGPRPAGLAHTAVAPAKDATAGVLPAAVPDKGTIETESQSAYQFYLAEALTHQALSDSLKDLADEARRRVRESDDPNDRWVWQKQIMLWEKRARDEEGMADFLYEKMEGEKAAQTSFPAVNPPKTLEVNKVIGGMTVYRYTGQDSNSEAGPDTRSTTTAAAQQTIPAPMNRFDILNHSPYNAGHPIPMDVALPRGTFYRIQLGAFGSALEPGSFGGITPLTGEYASDKRMIKYYAGKFSRYEDASAALPRIQSLGYEDAFIVAWYNGIQVTTQKAKQLE
jgi:tetratricopeptide (TPR) repeat protein